MKRLAILSLALFSLHFMHAQKDSTFKFTTFSSSRTSIKAKALYIDLHASNTKLIKQKLAQCKNVALLKITGSVTDSLWDILFTECKKLPRLKNIQLGSSNLETLPQSFYDLKGLEEIKIEDCDLLDWNNFFKNWSSFSSLKTAYINMWDINEIDSKNPPPALLQKLSITENYFKEDLDSLAKEPTAYSFEGKKNHQKLSINIKTEKENVNEMKKHLSNLTEGFSLALADDNKIAKQPTTHNNSSARGIRPLSRSLNSNTTSFTYSPKKPQFYWLPSGSSISVPDNAFCYADGKAVKNEEVQIQVSEYKSVADIILNQIPMKLDSGNTDYQLETAGMISVQAYANEKPLDLIAGKNLLINFSSIDSANNFNLYSFNDSTKAWNSSQNLRTATEQKSTKKDTALPFTSACKYFQYLSNYDARPRDTTAYLNRFYSKNYINNLNKEYFVQKRYMSYAIRPSSYKKVFRIVKTHKTADTNVVFRLDKRNPELTKESGIYAHTWWKLDEKMEARQFRKNFIYRKKINDMRVTAENGKNLITLKTEDGFISFHAHPVMLTANDKIHEYRDMGSRSYKRYQRRLTSENRALLKTLKRQKTNPYTDNKCYLPRKRFTQEEAFAEAKNKMNKKEIKLNQRQWLDYYNKVRRSNHTFNWIAYDNPLNRAFTASKLGIYNCDRIMKMAEPVEILVKYVDSTGTEIMPATNYVYYKKARSVWGYYNTNTFSVSGSYDNQIFIIGVDGKYYKAIVPARTSVSFGKELKLAVTAVNLDGKNDKEISEMLGVN